MRRIALLAFVVGFLTPFLASAPAQAQATRTWVSGFGDDVKQECVDAGLSFLHFHAREPTRADGSEPPGKIGRRFLGDVAKW